MKLLSKYKRSIISVLAICLLAIIIHQNFGATAFASIYFGNRIKKVPIYSVQTSEKKVAISFDAAWGADKTEQIMDVCDTYGVKATFFLVGFWVEEYPETTKLISTRGFEIGMHSSTHPNMTTLSKEKQKLELVQNRDIIYSVTGTMPKLFRPPFGAYNDELISTCESLDITTIQWDVDSLDWKGLSAGELSSRVCSRVKNGSIVLFHNNSDNIIDGLKMCLEFLTNSGYQVCPIGELIYDSGYTINQQGIQIKK